MGQRDTDRIEHDNENAPTTFRQGTLDKILDELSEEDAGEGFSEVIKSGVFVSQLRVWADPSMTRKRTQTEFTRSGPFMSSIIKRYYDDDTGTTQVSSVTVTITRNPDNTVADVTVVRSRP